MMDRKDLAIGILSTTAAILLVGLVLVEVQPKPAFGDGMTVSGGGYTMTVGRVGPADEELVYVLDHAAEKMASYRFNFQRSQIEIVQGTDLGQLRRPGAQPGGKRGGKP
jgi:hypothetical protein